MTIEEAIADNLRKLPITQKEDFVEFLTTKVAGLPPSTKHPTKHLRRKLIGRYAHLHIQISDEEIAEARYEMWGSVN
jgi:hypothetical protein